MSYFPEYRHKNFLPETLNLIPIKSPFPRVLILKTLSLVNFVLTSLSSTCHYVYVVIEGNQRVFLHFDVTRKLLQVPSLSLCSKHQAVTGRLLHPVDGSYVRTFVSSSYDLQGSLTPESRTLDFPLVLLRGVVRDIPTSIKFLSRCHSTVLKIISLNPLQY